MTPNTTLAMLERAPDRQTAELLLLSAWQSGAKDWQLQKAWAAWKRTTVQEVP